MICVSGLKDIACPTLFLYPSATDCATKVLKSVVYDMMQ